MGKKGHKDEWERGRSEGRRERRTNKQGKRGKRGKEGKRYEKRKTKILLFSLSRVISHPQLHAAHIVVTHAGRGT